MTPPELTLDTTRGQASVRMTGALVTEHLGLIESRFAALTVPGGTARIDLSTLEALDTGGALMIITLRARLKAAGVDTEVAGATAEQLALLETVASAIPAERGIEDVPRGFGPWLTDLGQKTAGIGTALTSFSSFLGEVIATFLRVCLRPGRLRMPALFSQMQETGLNAVPIVVLMSFLIGVVLAFQGASQLRQFGAEVFVVELIAVSMLRELGILLTAIIVAGRSGSAFTASIGSMKVREEIDAMRALGLNPMEVLVLPRVMALVLMLPILGFVSNMAGLIGGALMSWIELGVSPSMFVTRLQANVAVEHLIIGMVKAPFFGLVIAVVACWQAMQVSGSSESVGRRTTTSVVQAIFLVIVLDAIFSVFFSELGI